MRKIIKGLETWFTIRKESEDSMSDILSSVENMTEFNELLRLFKLLKDHRFCNHSHKSIIEWFGAFNDEIKRPDMIFFMEKYPAFRDYVKKVGNDYKEAFMINNIKT